MGGGYDSHAGGKRPEMATTWSDPNFAGKFARQDPQQLDARAFGAPADPDDWKRGYGSRDKRGTQQWARDDSGRDDGSDYSSGQRPRWNYQQQGHARAPQGSAASSRRPSRLGSPTYSPPPETDDEEDGQRHASEGRSRHAPPDPKQIPAWLQVRLTKEETSNSIDSTSCANSVRTIMGRHPHRL